MFMFHKLAFATAAFVASFALVARGAAIDHEERDSKFNNVLLVLGLSY